MFSHFQLPWRVAFLRHAEQTLNRWISQSSAAMNELAALEGHSMCIEIDKTSWRIMLSVVDGHARLSGAPVPPVADIVIRAGVAELIEALRARSVSQLSGRSIEFRGSLRVAEQFSRMLALARPQLEDELAGWVGGLPARVLAQAGSAAIAWTSQSARAVAQDSVEFLQYESRTLPLAEEVDEFLISVERLRDAVERLEQRVGRLGVAEKP